MWEGVGCIHSCSEIAIGRQLRGQRCLRNCGVRSLKNRTSRRAREQSCSVLELSFPICAMDSYRDVKVKPGWGLTGALLPLPGV